MCLCALHQVLAHADVVRRIAFGRNPKVGHQAVDLHCTSEQQSTEYALTECDSHCHAMETWMPWMTSSYVGR